MIVATRQKNWSIESLELMFFLGAHTEELKTCISEKEAPLRLNGAKLRNKPAGHKASAGFISTLPESALEIVKQWFSKKTKFDETPSAEAALEYFKGLEFEEYKDEKTKKYWRAILGNYCHKKPVDGVVEFLKNQPESKSIKSKIDEPKVTLSRISVDTKSLNYCLGADTAQRDLNSSDPLHIFVAGIIAAARNEIDAVAAIGKIIDDRKLAESEKIKDLFDQVLKSFPAVKKSLLIRESTKAETFGYIDPEKTLALATITNHLPSGQFFARVEGVFFGDKFITLSTNEAKELFKFSGDITGYQNKLTSNHHDGEVGLWRVIHQNTEKKTQYAISEHKARVYEIIPIPHKSDEPDNVRIWIQTVFQSHPGLYPIFELTDGLLVRAPWDLSDTSNSKFEKALEIFEELQAFITPQGSKIVVGPLPVSSKKFDCAPIGTLIKRILRLHEKSMEFPAFTKNQAQIAADFLSSQDIEILESNLSRTKSRLENAAEIREKIESYVELILAIPQVSNAVESEKSKIIAEFIKSRISEENALSNLRNQQVQAQEAIEAAQKNSKQIEVEISKQIKNAFERASRDGIKTLADIAVFKSILGDSPVAFESKKGQVVSNLSINPLKTIAQGNPIKTIDELANALGRAAAASNLSTQLIQYVAAALLSSSAVGLLGKRRSSIAPAIASVASSGVFCQLSVGADIFSPADLMLKTVAVFTPQAQFAMALGDFIDFQNEAGKLCIVDVLGSNRAPLDSYMPELIEHASTLKNTISIPWTDSTGKPRGGSSIPPILFLLNFVSGNSTFPISNEMLGVIPFCDAGHKWGDEDEMQTQLKLPNRFIETGFFSELINSYKSEKFSVEEGMQKGLLDFGMSEPDASELSQVAFLNSQSVKNLREITGVAKIQKNSIEKSFNSLSVENNSNN